MISEREQEGSVTNPFLNPIGVWQNYLTEWIKMTRNFENAVKTNEQWLKGLWGLWLKAGNPQQREKR